MCTHCADYNEFLKHNCLLTLVYFELELAFLKSEASNGEEFEQRLVLLLSTGRDFGLECLRHLYKLQITDRSTYERKISRKARAI